MSEEERYKKAKKRVQEIKGFYSHLGTYLVVNMGLVLIDLLSRGGFWFYWVTIFWGIGLGLHAVQTFGVINFLGPEWEERKIRELMGEKRKNDDL